MTRDFLVALLAGGEGSRIGGEKPARRLGGETLLDHALRHARLWSDRPCLVLRDPGQIEVRVGVTTLLDLPDLAGPLGGLAAALCHAREGRFRALLAIPCDMPFLPKDLPDRLQSEIENEAAAIAASGGRLHPICGLWRTTALDHLDAYRATGRRSLHGFASTIGFAAVEWPTGPIDPFFNVNSEQDLALAADQRASSR